MVASDSAQRTIDPRVVANAGLGRYRFLNDLQALSFVDALWLFGSRARGDFRGRSDIDLAVEAPRANAADWQRLFNLLDDADTLLAIDCVRLDTLAEHDPLRQRIEADGKLIYRRASR